MSQLEQYKDIPGYEGKYVINRYGEVLSLVSKYGKRKKPLKIKAIQHDNGYLSVTLCKNNKKTQMGIHRLVLLTYEGPCPEGNMARHLDGNKANNYIKNLKWGTPKENQGDRKIHGTYLFGEKHPMSKLKEAQIKEIRSSVGTPKEELMKKYGVCREHINAILRKRVWRHL